MIDYFQLYIGMWIGCIVGLIVGKLTSKLIDRLCDKGTKEAGEDTLIKEIDNLFIKHAETCNRDCPVLRSETKKIIKRWGENNIGRKVGFK